VRGFLGKRAAAARAQRGVDVEARHARIFA
jgi:hypothetical protein